MPRRSASSSLVRTTSNSRRMRSATPCGVLAHSASAGNTSRRTRLWAPWVGGSQGLSGRRSMIAPAAKVGMVVGQQEQPEGVGDAVDAEVLGAVLRGGVVAVVGGGLVVWVHGGGLDTDAVHRPHTQPPARGIHEGFGVAAHLAPPPRLRVPLPLRVAFSLPVSSAAGSSNAVPKSG